MPKGASHFKTFPEFSKLTLTDREVYDDFIGQFPPCSTLTFGNLMTWWSALDCPSVARHGDNLVISLWIPGDDERSGLTVIGDKKIDETFCAVFDFQRSRGQKPCITSVPEFVVRQLRFPDLFKLSGERDKDECLLDVKKLMNLSGFSLPQKSRIRKFLAHIDEHNIEVREINMASPGNKQLLLYLVEEWKERGGFNSFVKHEHISLIEAINRSEELGYRYIALYIKGSIHGFLAIQETNNSTYMIGAYIRLSYELPYIFEIATYFYAQWFHQQGVATVNIESDLGYSVLRNAKVALGPSNFIRMYTVTSSELNEYKNWRA